ncbi:MAG: hypothetical protein MJ153_01570 [Clostridia bacterium]|nr:hypothetical protein [Clostridia bacterium]
MKNKDAVRSPEFINSGVNKVSDSKSSVGSILRKANRDLIISRIVYAVLIVLLVAILFLAYNFGYLTYLVDKAFELIG